MCNCLKNKIGTVILDKSTWNTNVSDLKKLYSKIVPLEINNALDCMEIICYSEYFELSSIIHQKKYKFDFETQTFKKIDFGI